MILHLDRKLSSDETSCTSSGEEDVGLKAEVEYEGKNKFVCMNISSFFDKEKK